MYISGVDSYCPYFYERGTGGFFYVRRGYIVHVGEAIGRERYRGAGVHMVIVNPNTGVIDIKLDDGRDLSDVSGHFPLVVYSIKRVA